MKKCIQLCVVLLVISSGALAQDSTYKEMVGKYKFPAGSVIEEAIVTWENGVLTMNSAQGVSALERMKGDTFNVVSFSGIAVFKRDETRKITGVHVDASGYVMDGEKETDKLTGYFSTEEALIKTKQYPGELIQFYRSSNYPLAVCIYN
jgi:hypothetical protein